MDSAATLGEVLYADGSRARESEQNWLGLVRAVASGDQAALHALYERAYRPVFTLIMRISANRQAAEELTLDVFHDLWRRASSYDPASGSVLGWIMNQARFRAIEWADAAGSADVLESRERSRPLRTAVPDLTPHEQHAIEHAFFAGLTHAQAVARLDTPLGVLKTRIRSGLSKLRLALAAEKESP